MPPKRDGTRRFCVDFRQLNKTVVQDSYPLPNIQDLLERLSGARYFSKLDVTNAYWQIPIRESDRKKTAFFIGPDYGVYEFNRMPFGITTAPSTFQRAIDNLLSSCKYCLAYMDDIIIFSSTLDEHINNIDKVFNLFKEPGLKLSPQKCQLAEERIDFLGYQVDFGGVSVNSERTKPILDWSTPKKVEIFKDF